MRDPLTLARVYLIVGLVAMAGAGYFLYQDYRGPDDTFAFFDWAFLAMGGVAVFRGVKGLYELRQAKLGDQPKK